MLKMISGLLARLGGPRATHVTKHTGGAHWAARHSKAWAALGRCGCRECHLARATRAAPLRAARAVAACRAKMAALRERIGHDDVIHDGAPGPPGDAIDWKEHLDLAERRTVILPQLCDEDEDGGSRQDRGYVDADGRLRGPGGKVDPYEYGSTD